MTALTTARARTPLCWRGIRRWHVLERLARERQWRRGAELGLFRGETYLHLLARLPDLTLIGVDLWAAAESDAGDPGYRSYEGWPLAAFEEHVRAQAGQFGGRAIILKMTTRAAAERVAGASLDFVFIDADHTVKGVTGDIFAWAPKVGKNGWILGHDIHFPSVRRVVDDILPAYREYPDFVWGVPKARTRFAATLPGGCCKPSRSQDFTERRG